MGKQVGDVLRYLREHTGMSQIKASEKLGINNKTLSDYERNITEPDIETLKKIANLYNVPIDMIVGNTNGDYELDAFQYALHEEIKDLTDQQKQDILAMVKILKRNKS